LPIQTKNFYLVREPGKGGKQLCSSLQTNTETLSHEYRQSALEKGGTHWEGVSTTPAQANRSLGMLGKNAEGGRPQKENAGSDGVTPLSGAVEKRKYSDANSRTPGEESDECSHKF